MSGGKRKQHSKSQRSLSRSTSPKNSEPVRSWSSYLGPLLRRFSLLHPQPPGSLVVRDFDLDVTTEPIPQVFEGYGLTGEAIERFTRISELVKFGDPSQEIAALELFLEEFPKFPHAWNHLVAAYQSAGRSDDAERIMESAHRQFPDYLFAAINVALLRLHQGVPHEVPRVLKHRFQLQEWFPQRQQFHVSEVINFYGLLTLYHLRLGERLQAASYLDVLQQVDRHHPMTERCRSQMLLCLSDLMLGDD